MQSKDQIRRTTLVLVMLFKQAQNDNDYDGGFFILFCWRDELTRGTRRERT